MKETEKIILTFIMTILTLAMLSSMTSCRGSKMVYEYKSDWNKMPKKSTTTGWVYQSK
jgi:hypothetical protein